MRSNTNKSCHLSLKDTQELQICERLVATQKTKIRRGRFKTRSPRARSEGAKTVIVFYRTAAEWRVLRAPRRNEQVVGVVGLKSNCECAWVRSAQNEELKRASYRAPGLSQRVVDNVPYCCCKLRQQNRDSATLKQLTNARYRCPSIGKTLPRFLFL